MQPGPKGWRANSGKIATRRAVRQQERNARINGIYQTKECIVSEVAEYKSWICLICGWIYNEEDGIPEEGIAPATRFTDIPENWRCPLCDVGKADFVAVEF
jgi:rubredoxin